MSLDVRFDPAARHEMLEAAEFYDLAQPGLGHEFLNEVESALDVIAERRPGYWGTRK